MIRKLLSFSVSLALIGNSGNLAQAAALAPEVFAARSDLLPFHLAPPASLGRIVDYYDGGPGRSIEWRAGTRPAPTRPLVILIQDLHAHYGVQKNIAGLLEFLAQKLPASPSPLAGEGGRSPDEGSPQPPFGHLLPQGEKEKHVIPFALAVEGAAGPIDSSLLALFPDEKIKLAASDYLMREGELTGAEYFSIKRGLPHLVVGAENGEYYRIHRELFRKTLESRQALVKILKNLEAGVRRLPAHLYRGDALRIHRREQAYNEGRISLREWVESLTDESRGLGLDLKKQFPEVLSFRAGSGVHTAGSIGSMDMNRVGFQLRELSYHLTERAARTQEEKDLALLEHDLGLLARMADLQAAEAEVRAFGPRLNAFIALAQQLTARAAPHAFDEQELRQLLLSSIDFYAMARMRNEPMIDHTLALIEKKPNGAPSTAVLIAGGFHTAAMTQLLKAKKVSYVVISPTVESLNEKDHELYVRRLSGEYLTEEDVLARAGSPRKSYGLWKGAPSVDGNHSLAVGLLGIGATAIALAALWSQGAIDSHQSLAQYFPHFQTLLSSLSHQASWIPQWLAAHQTQALAAGSAVIAAVNLAGANKNPDPFALNKKKLEGMLADARLMLKAFGPLAAAKLVNDAVEIAVLISDVYPELADQAFQLLEEIVQRRTQPVFPFPDPPAPLAPPAPPAAMTPQEPQASVDSGILPPGHAWVKTLSLGSDVTLVLRFDNDTLIILNPETGKEVTFDKTQSPVTAGKRPQDSLSLITPSVSRRHAEFRHKNGQWVVIDLGSTNKTYVHLPDGTKRRLPSRIEWPLSRVDQPAHEDENNQTQSLEYRPFSPVLLSPLDRLAGQLGELLEQKVSFILGHKGDELTPEVIVQTAAQIHSLFEPLGLQENVPERHLGKAMDHIRMGVVHVDLEFRALLKSPDTSWIKWKQLKDLQTQLAYLAILGSMLTDWNPALGAPENDLNQQLQKAEQIMKEVSLFLSSEHGQQAVVHLGKLDATQKERTRQYELYSTPLTGVSPALSTTTKHRIRTLMTELDRQQERYQTLLVGYVRQELSQQNGGSFRDRDWELIGLLYQRSLLLLDEIGKSSERDNLKIMLAPFQRTIREVIEAWGREQKDPEAIEYALEQLETSKFLSPALENRIVALRRPEIPGSSGPFGSTRRLLGIVLAAAGIGLALYGLITGDAAFIGQGLLAGVAPIGEEGRRLLEAWKAERRAASTSADPAAVGWDDYVDSLFEAPHGRRTPQEAAKEHALFMRAVEAALAVMAAPESWNFSGAGSADKQRAALKDPTAYAAERVLQSQPSLDSIKTFMGHKKIDRLLRAIFDADKNPLAPAGPGQILVAAAEIDLIRSRVPGAQRAFHPLKRLLDASVESRIRRFYDDASSLLYKGVAAAHPANAGDFLGVYLQATERVLDEVVADAAFYSKSKDIPSAYVNDPIQFAVAKFKDQQSGLDWNLITSIAEIMSNRSVKGKRLGSGAVAAYRAISPIALENVYKTRRALEDRILAEAILRSIEGAPLTIDELEEIALAHGLSMVQAAKNAAAAALGEAGKETASGIYAEGFYVGDKSMVAVARVGADQHLQIATAFGTPGMDLAPLSNSLQKAGPLVFTFDSATGQWLIKNSHPDQTAVRRFGLRDLIGGVNEPLHLQEETQALPKGQFVTVPARKVFYLRSGGQILVVQYDLESQTVSYGRPTQKIENHSRVNLEVNSNRLLQHDEFGLKMQLELKKNKEGRFVFVARNENDIPLAIEYARPLTLLAPGSTLMLRSPMARASKPPARPAEIPPSRPPPAQKILLRDRVVQALQTGFDARFKGRSWKPRADINHADHIVSVLEKLNTRGTEISDSMIRETVEKYMNSYEAHVVRLTQEIREGELPALKSALAAKGYPYNPTIDNVFLAIWIAEDYRRDKQDLLACIDAYVATLPAAIPQPPTAPAPVPQKSPEIKMVAALDRGQQAAKFLEDALNSVLFSNGFKPRMGDHLDAYLTALKGQVPSPESAQRYAAKLYRVIDSALREFPTTMRNNVLLRNLGIIDAAPYRDKLRSALRADLEEGSSDKLVAKQLKNFVDQLADKPGQNKFKLLSGSPLAYALLAPVLRLWLELPHYAAVMKPYAPVIRGAAALSLVAVVIWGAWMIYRTLAPFVKNYLSTTNGKRVREALQDLRDMPATRRLMASAGKSGDRETSDALSALMPDTDKPTFFSHRQSYTAPLPIFGTSA